MFTLDSFRVYGWAALERDPEVRKQCTWLQHYLLTAPLSAEARILLTTVGEPWIHRIHDITAMGNESQTTGNPPSFQVPIPASVKQLACHLIYSLCWSLSNWTTMCPVWLFVLWLMIDLIDQFECSDYCHCCHIWLLWVTHLCKHSCQTKMTIVALKLQFSPLPKRYVVLVHHSPLWVDDVSRYSMSG